MPAWLAGHASGLDAVAAKAALIYVVVLIGLRIAHRRTVAQWSAIDFAAAVGVGSILGRTAVASEQSLLTGVVALAVILALHYLATVAHRQPVLARMLDHRVRVLVDHGRIRPEQLRAAGLSEADLHARLRQEGVRSLSELRWVLYENKGQLSVFREPGPDQADPELVREVVAPRPGEQVRSARVGK